MECPLCRREEGQGQWLFAQNLPEPDEDFDPDDEEYYDDELDDPYAYDNEYWCDCVACDRSCPCWCHIPVLWTLRPVAPYGGNAVEGGENDEGDDEDDPLEEEEDIDDDDEDDEDDEVLEHRGYYRADRTRDSDYMHHDRVDYELADGVDEDEVEGDDDEVDADDERERHHAAALRLASHPQAHAHVPTALRTYGDVLAAERSHPLPANRDHPSPVVRPQLGGPAAHAGTHANSYTSGHTSGYTSAQHTQPSGFHAAGYAGVQHGVPVSRHAGSDPTPAPMSVAEAQAAAAATGDPRYVRMPVMVAVPERRGPPRRCALSPSPCPPKWVRSGNPVANDVRQPVWQAGPPHCLLANLP
jgi:hypothetical protein